MTNSPSAVVRTSVDMMKYAFEQIEYAREYLVNFEAKHANDTNEYGKKIIKKEFITNRIPL